jgi:hypothetical protein
VDESGLVRYCTPGLAWKRVSACASFHARELLGVLKILLVGYMKRAEGAGACNEVENGRGWLVFLIVY